MQTIREIMTSGIQTVEDSSTIAQAAQMMRDNNIGDVIITRDGTLCGIVTDRDITVRAVAAGLDTSSANVGDICTADLTTITADADASEAVSLMRHHAVRRLPVVDNGLPIGIVSIGDLAVERDNSSALADISSAQPNN